MKFYYFSDESEKSLSPFFAPKMLSTIFYSTLIITILLIIFWPWKLTLVSFIRQHRGPFVFFPVCTATLILFAYIHLRCGCGEMVRSHFALSYLKQITTFEQEYGFLQYGLVESLLHTIFSLLPVLPLFILATSISGLSFTTMGQGVSMVFITALFCRLLGFLTYLLWGRGSSLGYFVSRLTVCLLLFATAVHVPVINPIRILYALNKNLLNFSTSVSVDAAYLIYTGMILMCIVLLSWGNSALVQRHIRREEIQT